MTEPCTHRCHRPTDDVWSGHCEECEPKDDLTYTARMELLCLWGDMNDARDSRLAFVAGGGMGGAESWSIRMDNLAERIRDLSRLVGVVPWRSVPVSLLRADVYQRVYEDCEYEPIDWDKVAWVESWTGTGDR
jgi:hypothetical protein